MANTSLHGELPLALKNFDQLPDSANVRRVVVESLLGCSRATIWRMVSRGALPSPRKLSTGLCAWNVGELRQFLSR